MRKTGYLIVFSIVSAVTSVAFQNFSTATPDAAGPALWTPAQATACAWNNLLQNELISILNGSSNTVGTVRASSNLVTQLPGGEVQLQIGLKSLLRFQIKDYVGNCVANGIGSLDLLPTQQDFTQYQRCPNSPMGAGCTDANSQVLNKTSLFQEDALYSVGPWMEGYAPDTGGLMNHQIFGVGGLWDQLPSTNGICKDDMDRYVIGQLPGWDGGAKWIDAEYKTRCALFTNPNLAPLGPSDRYSRSNSPYLTPMNNGAVYGANSDELNCQSETGCNLSPQVTIAGNDAHDLLKYSCLRAVLKGETTNAVGFFDSALNNWDGMGFPSLGSNQNYYYTHDLALALVCANALGENIKQSKHWQQWSSTLQANIESKLWTLQDIGLNGHIASGGIWNTYCNISVPGCQPNPYHIGITKTGIAPTATMLNEDAALVLSAYGKNLWQPQSGL